jgi:hypothetical protein
MYWRLLVALMLILMGVILLLPAYSILPLVMDLAIAAGKRSDQSNSYSQQATATPFQPLPTNHAFFPIVAQTISNNNEYKIIDVVEPVLEGFDFSPTAQQIVVRIVPQDQQVISSQSVDIAFYPGEQCIFGDGQACIYSFLSSKGSRVILASLHSGVGGEGQDFRDALEGTGFNQGLFTSERIYHNTQGFAGAAVSLMQGDKLLVGNELIAIVRIPPEHLKTYLALPVEDILDLAVDLHLLDSAILNEDLLMIETCGWRLPGERWVPGVSDTSGSVYLGLVRVAN